MQRYLLNAARALIFTILIATPLFYIRQAVYPYIFPKTLIFQFLVELLVAVWIALVIFDRKYLPRRTPLLLAGGAFLAVLLITAFTGVDWYKSFWSSYERMIGIFAYMHFLALLVILSSLYKELPWRALLYASVYTAAFVCFLAILQKGNPKLLLEEPIDRPGATFGNPTFFAGYIVLNVFIGLYLFLCSFIKDMLASKYINWRRASIAVCLGLFIVALFLTETRGDLLGLAAGSVALLAILAIRPPTGLLGVLSSRRFYAGILVGLVVFGTVFWVTRDNALWENVPGLNRFRNITFSLAGSEEDLSLLPRVAALKAAWQGFLERPLRGWGWENFNVVFNKHYDPRVLELSYQETRFDKPHNFFLEDLVAGGIPLFLARIAFLGILIWQAWKIRSLFGRIAIAAIVAYGVRNFFIFDTIGPMLVLYLFVGLIDGEYRAMHETSPRAAPAGKRVYSPAALTTILAVGVLGAALINIPSVLGAYYEFLGFKRFRQSPARGIENFERALAMPSPYRWNFARDYAAAVAETHFYNPGAISPEQARRAIGEMERVAILHPQDAYNHYALVDMYNQTSDVDPERYLAAAEREAAIALELSPRRQEIYFSMAKTKSIRGDYAAAIEIAKKALELNPRIADAHFYYGLLLAANKDLENGYIELKKAIELGKGRDKKWKNYYEPRTVADFFADAGHLDEAIELYLQALAIEPGDVESKLKLGVAYFFIDDLVLAKKYLGEASQGFDFKSSPAYPSLKPILDQLGIQ